MQLEEYITRHPEVVRAVLYTDETEGLLRSLLEGSWVENGTLLWNCGGWVDIACIEKGQYVVYTEKGSLLGIVDKEEFEKRYEKKGSNI